MAASVSLVPFLVACSAGARPAEAPPSPVVAKGPEPYGVLATPSLAIEGDVELRAAIPRSAQAAKGGSPSARMPLSEGAELAIEAHMNVVVSDLGVAVAATHAAAAELSAQIASEVIQTQEDRQVAALALRVPSAQTSKFLDRVAALGRVEFRKIESEELGRAYSDAQVLVRNLEDTMKRYEQLLSQAQTVADMTALEAALASVRTELDRVRSDLAWMRDQVARSTVYLELTTDPAVAIAPEAKMWPGVRLVTPTHFTKGGSETFAGVGFSFFFDRAASLDVDWAKSVRADHAGQWFSVSFGGDMYSDFLGGGRRRVLNPYLGFRVGYIHALGLDEGSAGGSLGLELLRTELLLLDLQTRVLAVFGSKERGLHALVQPALSLHFAF